MYSIGDLHIDEILPLFDYTNNDFAKERLSDFFNQPQTAKRDILVRQAILKGFIANHDHLKSYSYSRLDLLETYHFLQGLTTTLPTRQSFTVQLWLSEKERHQKRARLTQLVLMFNRVYKSYLQMVDIQFFPVHYQVEIKMLLHFFETLKPGHYVELIQADKFSIRDMYELNALLCAIAASGEITAFWKRLFLFEAYLSLSIGIINLHFSFPEFSDEVFSLRAFYHPLVKEPVTNDLRVLNNVVIITGPNMSGKSTFLKSVALCVYLGHLGLAIPASGATMPVFESIYVSINLKDDIKKGYSHFMKELMSLKQVVSTAGKQRCFAVFDELFKGTNMEDALEISKITIEGLTRFKGSLFVISTHLHQLKKIDEVINDKADTYHFHCTVNGNTPTFTFRLKKGWSDLSIGRMLFEREGLYDLLLSNYNPSKFDKNKPIDE